MNSRFFYFFFCNFFNDLVENLLSPVLSKEKVSTAGECILLAVFKWIFVNILAVTYPSSSFAMSNTRGKELLKKLVITNFI